MQFGLLAKTAVNSWLTCCCLVGLAVCPAHAAPRTPTTDAEVLERLPLRAGDHVARELATLRAELVKDPMAVNPATQLAQAYFDLAMARGDPRYVGYAEAVLARFGSALSAPMLLVRGQLLQYRHHFDAALDDFAAALAQAPDLAGAHAWRAAIFLVQADYVAARRECQALQQLGRVTLFGGCLGMAQAYNGQLQAADATLQAAMQEARSDGNRLWLLTRLGEVAAWRGQHAVAERHFRAALSLDRDDGYLLAAWSDFLLDAGRPAEVVDLLSGWEASDGLLLRLAEAQTLLKHSSASRLVQAIGDRFAAAKLRGDTTHRAEEARFELRLRHNPGLAVQLAAANYQVQREPRDARVLLEAAAAAGDKSAAKVVRDWLQSSGFEDVRLRRLSQ